MGTSERIQKNYCKNPNAPGVGQYNLDKQNQVGPKYTMRPRSYYNDSKDSLQGPGPGMYNPNFNIEHKQNEKYTMRPKTAQIRSNSVNPGPGQYCIRNDRSDMKQPSYIFGKETKLLPTNKEYKYIPGPGNYTANDKSVSNMAPKFSFGKDERGTQNTSRLMTPGPGQYQNKNQFGSGGPKISMSFVRPQSVGIKTNVPGPGMYSSSNVNLTKAPQYK